MNESVVVAVALGQLAFSGLPFRVRRDLVSWYGAPKLALLRYCASFAVLKPNERARFARSL